MVDLSGGFVFRKVDLLTLLVGCDGQEAGLEAEQPLSPHMKLGKLPHRQCVSLSSPVGDTQPSGRRVADSVH